MLNTPLFGGSKLRAPSLDFDPSILDRVDLSHRFESGVDAVTDAIRSASGMPGRRERRVRRAVAPTLVILGAVALLGLLAAWLVRASAAASALALEHELDDEAIQRAATDGMPTAADPVAPFEAIDAEG